MKVSPLLFIAITVYSPTIEMPRFAVNSGVKTSRTNQDYDLATTRPSSNRSDESSASLLPIESQTFKTTKKSNDSQKRKNSDADQYMLFGDSISSQSRHINPNYPKFDLNTDDTEKSPGSGTNASQACETEIAVKLTHQAEAFSQVSDRDVTIRHPVPGKLLPDYINLNAKRAYLSQ